MKPTLESRYSGCLVGAMLGDIAGAPVEAETAGYIRKTFPDVDAILALNSVPEPFGGHWQVGRYTDDTAMLLAVADWLAENPEHKEQQLFQSLSKHYDPARRFGPGTARIIETFRENPSVWNSLPTAFFEQGSYGNGSATRVAPVGLYYHYHLPKLRSVAIRSSKPTHAHPLAKQGCVLQAAAVALAVRLAERFTPVVFLELLSREISALEELGEDITVFQAKLKIMADGLRRAAKPAELVNELGNSIKVHESVPAAVYCFLHAPDSFSTAISHAIFLGGDTDTIACMTGAISGAFVGYEGLPSVWLAKIREQEHDLPRVMLKAERLFSASMTERHRQVS
jgi:poly(ADP-ribose) glycohydrolase ARH3